MFYRAIIDALLTTWRTRMTSPIDMILYCPRCHRQHIDAPEPNDEAKAYTDPQTRWTNPPHRSHLCAHCGVIWRPADVCTNGVAKIKTEGKRDTLRFTQARATDRVERLRENSRAWYQKNKEQLKAKRKANPKPRTDAMRAAERARTARYQARRAEARALEQQAKTARIAGVSVLPEEDE